MTKRDSLGRRRNPKQNEALRKHRLNPVRPGLVNRSHSMSMSEAAHQAFASLSPVQRGELVEMILSACQTEEEDLAVSPVSP